MIIEEFKNITVAYMRSIGEYGSKNERFMEEFKDFLKNNNLINDETIILGIALDNPAATPTEDLRYDVGLIINEDKKISLNIRKIDDGKYAIYEVAHTKHGIMEFWTNIPQLTKSLSLDYDKPIIERYTMNKVTKNLCEFCIPIKDGTKI